MSRKVIALRGVGSSGKTETIWRLRDLMISRKFESISDFFNPHRRDFRDVLKKGNLIVGVTSVGDDVPVLIRNINPILEYNPSIIVCACRSFGRTNEYLETTSRHVQYVEKRFEANANERNRINELDARRLWRLIS